MIDNNERNNGDRDDVRTSHPPPRCAKSAEDDRWYESCHGFFTLHHPCRRFLQVCADLRLFLHSRKSISNHSPISLVLAGLPTPKRLMLILDEKWEAQKSIYKSTYLFLGISVAIVSRKGITLFGYMYHPYSRRMFKKGK